VTDQEWLGWVERYAAMLNLGSAADMAMLGAWRPEFIGSPRKDLDEAFRRMAASDQILAWRADHRRYLHVHLNAIKREKNLTSVKELEDCEDRYRCKTCIGSGHVLIPHPSSIREGLWDYKTTLVVSCDCTLGKSRAERFNTQSVQHDFPPIRSVDWANAVLPEWRELMEEQKIRQKRAALAEDLTKVADRQGEVKFNRSKFLKGAFTE